MLINKVLCTRSRLFYNTSALDPFCPRCVRKNWTGYFAIGKSTYSALGTWHERANVRMCKSSICTCKAEIKKAASLKLCSAETKFFSPMALYFSFTSLSTSTSTSTNQRFVKRFVKRFARSHVRTFVPSAECRVSRFVQDEIKSRPCISKMYRLPINRRTNILICSAIHPLSIDRLKTMYLERRKKKLYYKPLLGRRLEASELFTWTYFLFFLIIPICALIAKASQHSLTDFITIATQPIALSAYSVTFSMAFLASLFNAFFGFILAWVLVRYNFTGKRLLDAAIDLPFAVPTSVAGLTLATVYSPNGWIGSLLQQFGIQVVYTRLGVATAMVFVSLPFVVRSLQPVLQEIDSQIEEAAWALGASPYTTFRRVLAPTLLPAFLTGITLGFSRAIGEYGSLVIVSANIPYKDLIASVLIFQNLEQYSLGQATVIATVVLFISFAILLGVSAIQSWNRNKLSSGQK